MSDQVSQGGSDDQTESHIAIKAIPAMRVLSLRRVIENYPAQGQLWKEMYTFYTQHNIERAAAPPFATYFDQGYKPTNVDVAVCQPITSTASIPSDLPEGMTVKQWPAIVKAVCLTHLGSYDGLFKANQAMHRHIVEEKYEIIGLPREEYAYMDPTDSTGRTNVTVLQVPIA